MQHITSILVGTDLSEKAARAEKRAAMLFPHFQTETVELLNVQEAAIYDMFSEMLRTEKRSVEEVILASLRARADHLETTCGVHFDCNMRMGKVAPEILKRCTEMDAGLLIVGAHGNNLHNDIFVGNVTEKLLHLSQCPILIVRQLPEKPYQHILILVDFSEECMDMTREALGFARPATKITLLHSYEIPNEGLMHYASVDRQVIEDFRERARHHAEKEMKNLLSFLDRSNRLTHIIKLGEPIEVIREYVNAHNPDLIIMGKRSSSRIEEMLLGSVSKNVIQDTSCDVMIIPSRILEVCTEL